MKANVVSKTEFMDLFYKRPDEFMRLLNTPEVFVVKSFYDGEKILALRKQVFDESLHSAPSWHPLLDGCPDYHRLHDNYEKAYVKGKIHTFYHHGYYEKNAWLFDFFSEIFAMKNFLAGKPADACIRDLPSSKLVARLNLHQYPLGGGFQEEHVDPTGSHALIQTLVQASKFGEDFKTGGVYARAVPDGEKFFVDPYTEPGDLMVISPGIRHGVAPVDPEKTFDWSASTGRWIILPIFVHSDYPHEENIKPWQVYK